MKYVPPLDALTENESYHDVNPEGADGSIVPAAAIENPQREIVALITSAGIVPSGGSLAQAASAVNTIAQNKITVHEQSTTSHADLRQSIALVATDLSNIKNVIPPTATIDNQLADKAYVDGHTGGVTEEWVLSAVETAIYAHNSDNSAHIALRDIIDERIADHDSATEAHADIRATLQSKADQTTVDGIQALIPPTANVTNKLADQNFVNSSITNMAANKVSYNAAGAPFPTHAALVSATIFYHMGITYTPTAKDYVTVSADEDAPSPFTNGQTRYVYDGAVWVYDEGINDAPFTASQQAAIDSTVTQADMAKLRALPTQNETVFTVPDWNVGHSFTVASGNGVSPNLVTWTADDDCYVIVDISNSIQNNLGLRVELNSASAVYDTKGAFSCNRIMSPVYAMLKGDVIRASASMASNPATQATTITIRKYPIRRQNLDNLYPTLATFGAHTNDTTIHVTQAEKDKWNSAPVMPAAAGWAMPPEVFDFNNTQVYSMAYTPKFIQEVVILSGSTFHYLQEGDYSFTGTQLTINNPTLVTGDKIKVMYCI